MIPHICPIPKPAHFCVCKCWHPYLPISVEIRLDTICPQIKPNFVILYTDYMGKGVISSVLLFRNINITRVCELPSRESTWPNDSLRWYFRMMHGSQVTFLIGRCPWQYAIRCISRVCNSSKYYHLFLLIYLFIRTFAFQRAALAKSGAFIQQQINTRYHVSVKTWVFLD